MARTNKRTPVVITPSAQASVSEIATNLWGQMYSPVEGDAEKTAAAHKTASDKMQKLMDELRARRDASKPVLRRRLASGDVIAESLGKSLGDLQASYVEVTLGKDANGKAMTDRISIPKLRQFSEIDGHPYNAAANAFLKANKVRFIEREGKGNGKKQVAFERA